MGNIQNEPARVQTEEGVIVERYPYEDMPRCAKDQSWYETGLIDGFCLGLVVCSLIVLFGYVLTLGR
jgi:hypothetical protein